MNLSKINFMAYLSSGRIARTLPLLLPLIFASPPLPLAASDQQPGSGLLVQVYVDQPSTGIEIERAYQRGNQVFIQFDQVPDGSAVSVPVYWINVLDLDVPSAVAVLTMEPPDEEDRILYEGLEKQADYSIDPEHPWVNSAEFGKEINILHYPWVFLPGHGYLYLYPENPAVPGESLPTVQDHPHADSRWMYSASLGFFSRVTFGRVWPSSGSD